MSVTLPKSDDLFYDLKTRVFGVVRLWTDLDAVMFHPVKSGTTEVNPTAKTSQMDPTEAGTRLRVAADMGGRIMWQPDALDWTAILNVVPFPTVDKETPPVDTEPTPTPPPSWLPDDWTVGKPGTYFGPLGEEVYTGEGRWVVATGTIRETEDLMERDRHALVMALHRPDHVVGVGIMIERAESFLLSDDHLDATQRQTGAHDAAMRILGLSGKGADPRTTMRGEITRLSGEVDKRVDKLNQVFARMACTAPDYEAALLIANDPIEKIAEREFFRLSREVERLQAFGSAFVAVNDAMYPAYPSDWLRDLRACRTIEDFNALRDRAIAAMMPDQSEEQERTAPAFLLGDFVWVQGEGETTKMGRVSDARPDSLGRLRVRQSPQVNALVYPRNLILIVRCKEW